MSGHWDDIFLGENYSCITMFVQLWIPWRYDVVAIYRQIPFS
ncbi:MAG: hypothetical protein ACEY3M_04030 [Wolbachia sp.]